MSGPDTAQDLLGGLSDELARVQNTLQKLLSSEDSGLSSALIYSLDSPGKLLRPGLLLLVARFSGTSGAERRLHLACAVEMLHIATLLHDDVIDSSGTRRRRPTAAAVFGEKTSVLLGDYIFAECLQLLASRGEFEALRLLSRAMALCVEGELAQQRALFNVWLSEDDYLKVVDKKTAAMFSASCRLGSLAAGHERAEVEALSDFGRLFGCGFQIIDDLYDFVGDGCLLGKPAGQDLEQGIITLPVIAALKGAALPAAFEERSANGKFDRFGAAIIRRLVLDSSAPEATLDAARDCFLRAKSRIQELDRADGLAGKLTALCAMTLTKAEEMLTRFRATTNKTRPN